MKNTNKKMFSDLKEQIEILKSKNLTIVDEKRANDILAKFNYYIIINGYRQPFLKDKDYKRKNEKSIYRDGATLEEIFAFYMFDRTMRIIFLKYILIVEQNFKSAISYEFSKKYGYENYLKFENFDYENKKNIKEIFYLIGNLHESLSKAIGKSNYIAYNIEKYNNVPFWILSTVITFGTIINFYKLMKREEQDYIAREYFKMKSGDLIKYIEVIKYFRNICAHDERLYDSKPKMSIPNNAYYKYFGIETNTYEAKNVFSLLIALSMVLEHDKKKELVKEVLGAFQNLQINVSSVKIEEFYQLMGFKSNFKDILTLNY